MDGESKQVILRLRAGHPSGAMLARLRSGEVVRVTPEGMRVDEEEITEMMRRCDWNVIEKAAETATPQRRGDAEEHPRAMVVGEEPVRAVMPRAEKRNAEPQRRKDAKKGRR